MKVTATVGLITEEYHISEQRTLAVTLPQENRSIVPKCANCRALLNPNVPYLQILKRCVNCFDHIDHNDNRRGALAFILSPDFDL